jgi:hypothetical protein
MRKDPLMGVNRKTELHLDSNSGARKNGRFYSLLVFAAFCIFVTAAFFLGKEFAGSNETERQSSVSDVATTWRDKVIPVDNQPRDLFAELDADEKKAKSAEKGPWEKYQATADSTPPIDEPPRVSIGILKESEFSLIEPGYGCSLRRGEQYFFLLNLEQSIMKVNGVVLQRELADKLFQEISVGDAEFRSGDYIIRIRKTGSQRGLYEGHEFPASMRVSKGTETTQVSGIFGCSA